MFYKIKKRKFKIINNLEEAIKIVGPLAKIIGFTKEDIRILLNYVDEMRNRGISGRAAGLLLGKYLKDCKDAS
jgi:hypothetical protein